MGLYFIALYCHHREPLFGRVVAGEMVLNSAGQVAYEQWLETARIRSAIRLHEFVIMPNHMHGIIEILPTGEMNIAKLGDVVRGYRSSVTKMMRLLPDREGVSMW